MVQMLDENETLRHKTQLKWNKILHKYKSRTLFCQDVEVYSNDRLVNVYVCVLFCGVTHVSTACCVLDFIQGATFCLNVAKVQFNAWNHDL